MEWLADISRRYVNNCMDFHVVTCLLVGAWPLNEHEHSWFLRLNQGLPRLVFFWSCVAFVMALYDLYMKRGDYELASESIIFILILGKILSRVHIVVYQMNSLVSLIRSLEGLQVWLITAEERAMYESFHKNAHRFTFWFVLVVTLLGLTVSLEPLAEEVRRFPMHINFPIENALESPVYELLYGGCVLFGIMVGLVGSFGTSIAVACLVYVAGHLKILQYKLEHTREYSVGSVALETHSAESDIMQGVALETNSATGRDITQSVTLETHSAESDIMQGVALETNAATGRDITLSVTLETHSAESDIMQGEALDTNAATGRDIIQSMTLDQHSAESVIMQGVALDTNAATGRDITQSLTLAPHYTESVIIRDLPLETNAVTERGRRRDVTLNRSSYDLDSPHAIRVEEPPTSVHQHCRVGRQELQLQVSAEMSNSCWELPAATAGSRVKVTRGGRKEDAINRGMDQHLLHCIMYHRDIFRFVNEYNQLYSAMLFFETLVGAVMMGIDLFKSGEVTEVSLAMAIWPSLFLVHTLEIWALCWGSSKVAEESMNVSDAVYQGDWLEASPWYQRVMQVVMSRAVSVVDVTLLSFVHLDLELFTSIANSGYSYFKIVKTMTTKNKNN